MPVRAPPAAVLDRVGSPASPNTEAGPARVQLRLDRHQRARDEQLPTISVVVGAPATARDRWAQWLSSRGQPGLFIALDDEPGPIAPVLAAAILRGRDVVHDVAVLLAPHAGQEPTHFERRLRSQGGPERATFFEHLASAGLPPRVGELARELLDAPSHPLRCIGDMIAVVALLQLLAPAQRPGLAIATSRLDRALGPLQAITEALPQLPVALAVEPGELDRFLAGPGSARDHARVREGLLRLDEPDPAPDPAPAPALAGARPSAGVEQLREQLTQLCRSAPKDADAAERARSLAERLLFEALADHPATVGRFELNARMPFLFGPRPAEIDLLSARDRVAIEIDGYYHFVDADAYRRDRRKDALLQRNGLFVLRFLAQDVAPSLHQIIDHIVDVLQRPPPPRASP